MAFIMHFALSCRLVGRHGTARLRDVAMTCLLTRSTDHVDAYMV
jgi:hypothetical protein